MAFINYSEPILRQSEDFFSQNLRQITHFTALFGVVSLIRELKQRHLEKN